ncbi:MAG: NUDIX hydrolase [Candidatus Levybacteria bacterium]|nr:NUDIX hydrolase [Candidatus Levybacteria bacterium]
MLKTIPTVGVIAISESRVLLVRHEEGAGHITGVYGLPAGRINNDESEQQAAAREFHEETGLYAKDIDFKEFRNNYYIADIPRKDGTIKRFGWRVFKVQNFFGELLASDETTPEWIEIEKLDKLEKEKRLLPNTLLVVNEVLKQ